MTKVRAKFQCNSVEQYQFSSMAKLTAVYSTTGENKDFNAATPSGRLEILIDSGLPAADFFKAGEEYYLDFSKANKV